MSAAKPVPLEVMVGCRDSCASWLARSLGLEAFRNPGTAALGLLLGGGLDHKLAEVARVIVWIDRALPMEQLVAEHESGAGHPFYIQAGKGANWYEVETAAPSDEDIQLHREVASREAQLNEALRKFEHQWNGLEDAFLRFCVAEMSLEESVTSRVQRGRVVRVVAGPRSTPESEEGRRAAERAIRCWTSRESRRDAMMLKYAAVCGDLGVFRELVQLRRPFAVTPTHPFAQLMIPSTLDEWHAARRVLEKALLDVGYDDAEVGEIMGDGRRRVAERRRRMNAPKTAE